MEEVLNNIPKGKANAIHLNDLAIKTGIGTAAIKKYIQQLRRMGNEICSGQPGYWIAETEEEKRVFVNSMYKNSLTRFATCKNLKKSLQEIPGQMDFLRIQG